MSPGVEDDIGVADTLPFFFEDLAVYRTPGPRLALELLSAALAICSGSSPDDDQR